MLFQWLEQTARAPGMGMRAVGLALLFILRPGGYRQQGGHQAHPVIDFEPVLFPCDHGVPSGGASSFYSRRHCAPSRETSEASGKSAEREPHGSVGQRARMVSRAALTVAAQSGPSGAVDSALARTPSGASSASRALVRAASPAMLAT